MSTQRITRKFCIVAIIVLLWGLPILAADSTNTTVTVDQRVVCVYPISGQYGHISRWLTYATLLFTILMQGYWAMWLVAGGLAATMVSTSGLVIHSIIILAYNGPHPEVLDLDVLAINAILVVSIHSVYFIVRWSPVMEKFKKRRRLILAWGLWIFIGFIINFITIAQIKIDTNGDAKFGDNICLSSNNTALESASQLTERGLTFNCNYPCFSSTKSGIRDASEIRVAPQDHILPQRYLGILILSLFAIPSCLLFVLVVKAGEEANAESKTSSTRNLNQRSRDRQIARLFPFLRKLAWVPVAVDLIVALASLAVFESQLLSHQTPTSWLAHDYISGQWAPAVATAFALIAPVLDRFVSET